MSALRLIGIAPAVSAPPDAVTAGSLAALVCAPVGGNDIAAIRAHHRAVVAQCRRGPFLPAPFGLDFDSDAGLSALLSRVGSNLLADLGRLAGRVEWSVRLAPRPPAAPDGAGPGRAFLAARRAHALAAANAAALAERLERSVPPEPVEAIRARVGDDGALAVALLLPQGSDGATAKRALDDIVVASGIEPTLFDQSITGPWPTYTFAALRARLQPAEEANDGG